MNEPSDALSGAMCGDASGVPDAPSGVIPNGVFSEEQSPNGAVGLSRLVRFVWLLAGVGGV